MSESETIEERYAIAKEIVEMEIEWLEGELKHKCTDKEDLTGQLHNWSKVNDVLRDLMEERQSVDLDALFPKEVTESAVLYAAYYVLEDGEASQHASSRHPLLQRVVDSTYHLKGKGEYDLVALDTRRAPTKELARVRVYLSLKVEEVGD